MKTLCAFLSLVLLLTHSAFAVDYEGDGKQFITDDVFTCPNSGLTFHAPDLKSPKLHVSNQEDAPGISWQLRFAEKKGQQLTVTYTKIREGYPKTDAILSRTAAHIKENLLQDGGYVEWCGFLSEKEGRVFQCIVRFPSRGKSSLVAKDERYNEQMKDFTRPKAYFRFVFDDPSRGQ